MEEEVFVDLYCSTRQLTDFIPVWTPEDESHHDGCLFFIPSSYDVEHTISLVTTPARRNDEIGEYDKLHSAEHDEAIPVIEGLTAVIITLVKQHPNIDKEDISSIAERLLYHNVERMRWDPVAYFVYEHRHHKDAMKNIEELYMDLLLSETQINKIEEIWDCVYGYIKNDAMAIGQPMDEILLSMHPTYEGWSHLLALGDASKREIKQTIYGIGDKIHLVQQDNNHGFSDSIIVEGIYACALNYAYFTHFREQIAHLDEDIDILNYACPSSALNFAVAPFYAAYQKMKANQIREWEEKNPAFAVMSEQEQEQHILQRIIQKEVESQQTNDIKWLQSVLDSWQLTRLQELGVHFIQSINKQLHRTKHPELKVEPQQPVRAALLPGEEASARRCDFILTKIYPYEDAIKKVREELSKPTTKTKRLRALYDLQEMKYVDINQYKSDEVRATKVNLFYGQDVFTADDFVRARKVPKSQKNAERKTQK